MFALLFFSGRKCANRPILPRRLGGAPATYQDCHLVVQAIAFKAEIISFWLNLRLAQTLSSVKLAPCSSPGESTNQLILPRHKCMTWVNNDLYIFDAKG